ncbi:MAG: flagellar biosynthetic protein FliO [Thermodesulfobacteriota bacterium]
MTRRGIVTGAPLLALAATAVQAAEEAARTVATGAAETGALVEPAAWPALLKVTGSLVLVLGLLAALAFWLRRLGLPGLAGRPGSLIRVLDQRLLGPKKSVAVLAVGQETILVGITDQAITFLSRLGEPPAPAAPEEAAGRPGAFASLLARAADPTPRTEQGPS